MDNIDPSKILERGQTVLAQLRELSFDVKGIIERYEDTNARLTDAEKAHGELTHDIGVLKASIEVMKQVAHALTEEGVKTLEDMVTQGLLAIYYDQKYRCLVEISERGTSKTAEIYLMDGDTKVPLKDATGGGIQTIVSLIIRAYFIITLGLRPFLVIDEGLYALSQRYVKPMFEFLQSLRDNANFTFVIVSHDPRSFEFADVTYTIKKGEIDEQEDPGQ